MPLQPDDIARLYSAHARGLLRFFGRRTLDAEAAVDLVAETFAAAHTVRGSFRGTGDEEAVAWLYGIARHQLKGWLRHGRVERKAMTRLGIERRELTDPEIDRIEQLAGLTELRARVQDALDRLPDEQRAAVSLRVIDEHPYPEVARLIGASEATARARVSRGLRVLSGVLGSDPVIAEARRYG